MIVELPVDTMNFDSKYIGTNTQRTTLYHIVQ